ncbi:4-hydroxythreonine-4-phosphate dehydrogenase [Thermogymnomonas acidicola]|uniref:4-hydroxythreonine-4-phosphate dehydrogenase n=1 Tax=Thermogymnomonas acidicola TaxID=399579 RepID=A0AA37BS30_9ARCH|nr:4-hydroxythreonine-4-phosphate dehydrogenase PdxA [Thermogymnomonas acidicola]GGM76182.1 4-hydroxythreonine-4-phosphate dehydrogenase [Thermogymnomonas acidicola]
MGKIAITLGDPAGIGPEIVLRSLAALGERSRSVVVVGNMEVMRRASRLLGLTDILERVDVEEVPGDAVEPGRVQEEAGRQAVMAIERAVRLAMSGEVEGICTAPINKEAMKIAGSRFIDHTEMLAHLTGVRGLLTLFESGSLRTTFVTKHMPLRKAIESLDVASVVRCILETDTSLRLLGLGRRIALAALNPHAGENGLLGKEEIDILAPAVEEASRVADVRGPFPSDSVYHRAASGEFDCVVSLYHDQGHIASKMHDFYGTVSMNTGMPFLRTSVDHGTAFDIAWQGKADHRSMLSAVERCFAYSPLYRRNYEAFRDEVLERFPRLRA